MANEGGNDNQNRKFHTLRTPDVLKALESGSEGLGNQAARARLEKYGPDRLPLAAGRSVFMRFLMQFHNILIYVLLGAAVITVALDHWVDSAVILAVVFVNAVIGFVQEGKAEKAMEATGCRTEIGRISSMLSLFSVRYIHGTSLTLKGVLGTKAVLWAVSIVTVLQLLFTYAPFMQFFFDAAPLSIVQGLQVVGSGLTILCILELEKFIVRQCNTQKQGAT